MNQHRTITRHEMQRLFADAPFGFVVYERVNDGLRIAAISERMAQLTGISVERSLGQLVRSVVSDLAEVAQIEPIATVVFDTGKAQTAIVRGYVSATGAMPRVLQGDLYPMYDGTRSAVEYVAVLVTDITGSAVDRRREEQARVQLKLLADTGELLSSVVDIERSLEQLVALPLPSFADVAWIRLTRDFEPGRDLQLFRLRRVDKQAEAHFQLLANLELSADLPYGAPRVLRTGVSELYPDMEVGFVERSWQEEHRAALRKIGVRSCMIVPIVGHGGIIGTMTFARTTLAEPYDEDDLQTVELMCCRAGMALDIARLFMRQQRQASVAAALEHSVDGVVLVGPDGFLRACNLAAESILGIERAAALNHPIDQHVPGWNELISKVQVAEPDEKPDVPTVYQHRGLDGDDRWITCIGVRVPAGVVYTLRDVSDLRELERMTTDVVATISHELRTPLTVLQGGAITLHRQDIELDSEVADQLLTDMELQANRLAMIIDGILTVQQLGAGSVRVRHEPVDVYPIVQTVVEDLRPLATDGVTFELDRPDEPVVAICDADRIRQVLLNLVDNAMAYSPKGGPIHISMEQTDGSVAIEVSDHGLGIPPADQARVFEKFVRLDPMQRKQRRGMGLGLYISRELVRQMGGQIAVESKVGVGSTFLVRLPAGHEAG